ncbi:hypothetical protein [Nocardiopsis sp. ATB16-24]|uniref:hypothetical protein n=1 Tax=Nocardiopsis sp. ATB16-24 TaxID=3019555 RepID=UPI002557A2D7|nr:hypothetical protein [Nocardiopsis sp. ATB16-24]
MRHDESTEGGRHLILTLSRPVPGQEAHYRRWYQERHLPQVCAIEGFVRASFHRAVSSPAERGAESPGDHLAVYEVEGDLEAAVRALHEAFAAGDLDLARSVQREGLTTWVFEQCAVVEDPAR